MICKNCFNEFEGNFCNICGQRPNNGRIVLRESLRDILEHYIDFDTPIFRTIVGLIIKPGKLIREYISGRRKTYSHPFRYFILVLAIYLIVKSITGFDPIEVFNQVIGSREGPIPDNLATKGSNFFSNHINSFLLLFALAIALFCKIFNRKSGVYLIEYFTLGLFIIAEYMFFSIFIVLLSSLSPYFFILNYILVFLYPMYVIVQFHDGNIFMRIIKAFFIAFFSWFFYAFMGMSISMFIVSYFGL